MSIETTSSGASWPGFKQAFGKQSDLLLVAAIVGILLVLFIPIPPGLLDFLLIINVHFALLILLITFYVEKPLQFSTFPTLLLIATLFRLSLNIAATRLILTDAHAGKVISTVGSFVVGGNYIIGLIIFLVLIVVQYVVVTAGAQRVAEVAARFTLDGMPGKQMSIDADLNMGLIDEKEAQLRRKQIEKEANFYGAMDGSSKFVKGDAIAGILIILINIIGGLTIGVAQRGMAWSEALQTFTLLTIGDGIVTQIPALIISTGTGIIVTRAASDAFLSKEIGHQITAFPKILFLVGLSLLFILILPETPTLPTFVALVIVGILFWFATRAQKTRQQEESQTKLPDSASDGENVYDMLAVEAFEVRVGQTLIPVFSDKDGLVMNRIKALRKQYALEMGFVMPWLRAKDDKKLEPQKYEIFIYGGKIGEGEIVTDRVLAIDPGGATARLDGVQTRDPTYNLPAWWITENQAAFASESGYTVVEPINVLLTHISEILRKRSHALLSRAETSRLLDRVKKADANLVDDLIPGIISLGVLQKILQNLLRENVSIRNLESILETLMDAAVGNKDPDYLTEVVRKNLGAAICQSMEAGESELQVLVLDQMIEQNIIKSLRQGEKPKLVLEPGFAEKVITRLANCSERMLNSSLSPILLCAPELRRHIRSLTERMIPDLKIVSLSEVPTNLSIKPFAIVSLDEKKMLES
jgi:flagellar biosynthesis protein FlhA